MAARVTDAFYWCTSRDSLSRVGEWVLRVCRWWPLVGALYHRCRSTREHAWGAARGDGFCSGGVGGVVVQVQFKAAAQRTGAARPRSSPFLAIICPADVREDKCARMMDPKAQSSASSDHGPTHRHACISRARHIAVTLSCTASTRPFDPVRPYNILRRCHQHDKYEAHSPRRITPVIRLFGRPVIWR